MTKDTTPRFIEFLSDDTQFTSLSPGEQKQTALGILERVREHLLIHEDVPGRLKRIAEIEEQMKRVENT